MSKDFEIAIETDSWEYISGALFGRNLSKKFERKQLSSGKVYYGLRIKRGADNIDREVRFERIKVDDRI